MGERGGLTGGFEFGKGLSYSRKPELAQLVEPRMGKQGHLPKPAEPEPNCGGSGFLDSGIS